MKERLGKKGEAVLWCGNRMFPTFFVPNCFLSPVPLLDLCDRQETASLPPRYCWCHLLPQFRPPPCVSRINRKSGRERGKKVVLPLVGEEEKEGGHIPGPRPPPRNRCFFLFLRGGNCGRYLFPPSPCPFFGLLYLKEEEETGGGICLGCKPPLPPLLYPQRKKVNRWTILRSPLFPQPSKKINSPYTKCISFSPRIPSSIPSSQVQREGKLLLESGALTEEEDRDVRIRMKLVLER